MLPKASTPLNQWPSVKTRISFASPQCEAGGGNPIRGCGTAMGDEALLSMEYDGRVVCSEPSHGAHPSEPGATRN